MLWDIVFWASLAGALLLGAVFFRDLGDVSQMFIKVKREQMIHAIRHEWRTVLIGVALTLVMLVAHLAFGAGPSWVFWCALPVLALFFGFPLVWVH